MDGYPRYMVHAVSTSDAPLSGICNSSPNMEAPIDDRLRRRTARPGRLPGPDRASPGPAGHDGHDCRRAFEPLPSPLALFTPPAHQKSCKAAGKNIRRSLWKHPGSIYPWSTSDAAQMLRCCATCTIRFKSSNVPRFERGRPDHQAGDPVTFDPCARKPLPYLT